MRLASSSLQAASFCVKRSPCSRSPTVVRLARDYVTQAKRQKLERSVGLGDGALDPRVSRKVFSWCIAGAERWVSVLSIALE